jgi:acetyl-CoA carboxylase biotin carboxyl carrier protein
MDLQHIKKLIDLMVENDLSRMELREGDTHILLRRGHPVMASMPGHAPAPMLPGVPPAVTTPAASPGNPTSAHVQTDNEIIIRSPMVGTFYSAPEPESPPFVNVGSSIEPDTVVCLIEAMKVFNDIKAEVSGVVTKLLVKNAQAVEFDQPLFAVRPA